MKKMMMVIALFVMVALGRTGHGTTYVKSISEYSSGSIDLITTTTTNDGKSAFRFHIDNKMGKGWLATLINAQNNSSPIYIYYTNESQDVPNLDKVEVRKN